MSTGIKFLHKESLFTFIENKYDDLKNDMGWDLLFCRYENMLSPQYPVAFFGINPGGGPCDTNAISVIPHLILLFSVLDGDRPF